MEHQVSPDQWFCPFSLAYYDYRPGFIVRKLPTENRLMNFNGQNGNDRTVRDCPENFQTDNSFRIYRQLSNLTTREKWTKTPSKMFKTTTSMVMIR